MDIAIDPWIPPRHERLDKLGERGMGVVYKARDRRLDCVVALFRRASNMDASRHFGRGRACLRGRWIEARRGIGPGWQRSFASNRQVRPGRR